MSAINVLKGLIFQLSGDNLQKLILGVTATEVINSTSGDAVPSNITNSRAISVDTDGIVKFDCLDDSGENTTTEVKAVKAGVMYPYRNITKVYRYYTGTTALTATVYGSDGVAVKGLKVHR